MADDTVIRQILDLARWAPSGDNTQPWRFEIVDGQHVAVHGHDTRHWCVYDLQGHASQLALGGLLETIAIAATGHGLDAVAQRRADSPEEHPVFDVRLTSRQGSADPLIPFITTRAVQRRPMQARPLSIAEKATLEISVGTGYRILWLEGWKNKWRAAKLMFDNARLRLTIPEAHAVHHQVIEWGTRFSEDRMPDQSIGLDPLTTLFSRWAMQSWRRVDFFNTYLGGTLLPRIELDLIPGLACAAHFAILAAEQPRSLDDFVAAGRAIQRFWLTAESLGLRLQPEMTPLIFSSYSRENTAFSATSGASSHARRLDEQLSRLIGDEACAQAIFMGRIGISQPPRARSLRLPLENLLLS